MESFIATEDSFRHRIQKSLTQFFNRKENEEEEETKQKKSLNNSEEKSGLVDIFNASEKNTVRKRKNIEEIDRVQNSLIQFFNRKENQEEETKQKNNNVEYLLSEDDSDKGSNQNGETTYYSKIWVRFKYRIVFICILL